MTHPKETDHTTKNWEGTRLDKMVKIKCIKCKVEKEHNTDNFYRHYGSKSSMLTMCKVCHAVQSRLSHRRTYNFEKDIIKTIKRKERGGFAETARRMREKYPEKYRARYLLQSEIRRGNIERKPCRECGLKLSEGHHPDYSKPLEVTWLCKKHHALLHRKPLLSKYQDNK